MTITTPTQPGWYWGKRDDQSQEIMVQVCITDGELTVFWPNEDTPVAKLKGTWRGPIQPCLPPPSQFHAASCPIEPCAAPERSTSLFRFGVPDHALFHGWTM